MNRNLIIGATLIMAIGFLILGIIFNSTADNHKGVSVTTGAIVNGQYIENTSGRIGEDKEKQESFETGGTIFYILAGISGVVCVISAIGGKLRE